MTTKGSSLVFIGSRRQTFRISSSWINPVCFPRGPSRGFPAHLTKNRSADVGVRHSVHLTGVFCFRELGHLQLRLRRLTCPVRSQTFPVSNRNWTAAQKQAERERERDVCRHWKHETSQTEPTHRGAGHRKTRDTQKMSLRLLKLQTETLENITKMFILLRNMTQWVTVIIHNIVDAQKRPLNTIITHLGHSPVFKKLPAARIQSLQRASSRKPTHKTQQRSRILLVPPTRALSGEGGGSEIKREDC